MCPVQCYVYTKTCFQNFKTFKKIANLHYHHEQLSNIAHIMLINTNNIMQTIVLWTVYLYKWYWEKSPINSFPSIHVLSFDIDTYYDIVIFICIPQKTVTTCAKLNVITSQDIYIHIYVYIYVYIHARMVFNLLNKMGYCFVLGMSLHAKSFGWINRLLHWNKNINRYFFKGQQKMLFGGT